VDPQNANTRWIEALFSVSEPYLYTVVLPPLVLFALGYRRSAVVFLLGAAAVFAILNI